jgi:hypothetical protein
MAQDVKTNSLKYLNPLKKLNIAWNCCMAGYLARIVVCINMLECKVYTYQHVDIELYTYACLYFWKMCMVEYKNNHKTTTFLF